MRTAKHRNKNAGKMHIHMYSNDTTYVAAGQQSSFTDIITAMTCCESALRLNNSKLAQKHHATLLQHFNRVIEPPSINIQGAVGDLAQLVQELQDVHIDGLAVMYVF